MCGWDGGDCCQCTRADCPDPDVSPGCETEISSQSDNYGCQDPQSKNVSDDQWNEGSNTAVCGWDGGDRYECICSDNTYACGKAGYDCLGPTQDCDPSVDVTAVNNESLSPEQVVGVLSASVVEYCLFLVVALAFVRHQSKA